MRNKGGKSKTADMIDKVTGLGRSLWETDVPLVKKRFLFVSSDGGRILNLSW